MDFDYVSRETRYEHVSLWLLCYYIGYVILTFWRILWNFRNIFLLEQLLIKVSMYKLQATIILLVCRTPVYVILCTTPINYRAPQNDATSLTTYTMHMWHKHKCRFDSVESNHRDGPVGHKNIIILIKSLDEIKGIILTTKWSMSKCKHIVSSIVSRLSTEYLE